jgi:hypothetical protein
MQRGQRDFDKGKGEDADLKENRSVTKEVS